MNLEQNTERNDMKDDTSATLAFLLFAVARRAPVRNDRHGQRQHDGESK